MPKYRILSQEELAMMESDFVKFLVLNGIVADDWTKLKADDPESADGIIASFSEVVFEQILRKAAYVDFVDDHEIYCIQCLEDKMVLVGAKSDGMVNFKTSAPSTMSWEGIKVFTTEKAYNGDRQKEIFDMLQNGYQLSDGQLFKKLCLAI